ncbi:hypothetical protein [Nannocystis punicea]|uniref:Glycosyl-4,4'-diaponeurosporenoate acyltransferase n=1 Tax=Nannocystis punicea TaxID=2995304 RepID=A0ABY7GW20_9BACT|nr:hypothetical protein [Nannocystis poenicansa]WAS91084.1 hypothetical protein O0S08_33270 [Nannocystis poenicansa]
MPTEQFWNLAGFTPITLAFWIPGFIFHDWLVFLGWSWWQRGLAVMAFAALWAGLVERWSRHYLARRRKRALTEGELEDAQEALVPSPVEPQKLPVFATHEFWDYAFARLFGRARGVALKLFEFLFFMAFFYPSALVLGGAFSLLVVISLGLGAWQRRLLRRALEVGGQPGPALADACEPGGSRPRTTA